MFLYFYRYGSNPDIITDNDYISRYKDHIRNEVHLFECVHISTRVFSWQMIALVAWARVKVLPVP